MLEPGNRIIKFDASSKGAQAYVALVSEILARAAGPAAAPVAAA